MLGKDKKDTKTTKEETSEESVDRSPRASRSTDRKTFDRASFRKPNDLQIPEALKKAFDDDGYFLRWVAVVDAKTKTQSNERINYFMSIGGDLVRPKDVADIDRTFLSSLTKFSYQEDWAFDGDDRNETEGIRKEHLVLMKIPNEYKEYRQEENRRLVEDQLATAQQEFKKNDDAFVKEFKHGSGNLKLKEGFFEK